MQAARHQLVRPVQVQVGAELDRGLGRGRLELGAARGPRLGRRVGVAASEGVRE